MDITRYCSVVAAIAAGHGLTILIATHLAGLTWSDVSSGAPAVVIGETVSIAVLLWPAIWLAIRRLGEHRTPGWLSLPAILIAALTLMAAAFGRPFSLPESPILNLLPLLLIVLASACLVVEGLGVGYLSAADGQERIGSRLLRPARAPSGRF
jgi:uncharacterized membrane protein YhaH (DUF805 family)